MFKGKFKRRPFAVLSRLSSLLIALVSTSCIQTLPSTRPLTEQEIQQFSREQVINPVATLNRTNITTIAFEKQGNFYGSCDVGMEQNQKFVHACDMSGGGSKQEPVGIHVSRNSEGNSQLTIVLLDQKLITQGSNLQVTWTDGQKTTVPLNGKRGLILDAPSKEETNITFTLQAADGTVLYRNQ